jgi:hypothetical protein
MAAMLERNGKDGKATPGDLPLKEVIRCSKSIKTKGCGDAAVASGNSSRKGVRFESSK